MALASGDAALMVPDPMRVVTGDGRGTDGNPNAQASVRPRAGQLRGRDLRARLSSACLEPDQPENLRYTPPTARVVYWDGCEVTAQRPPGSGGSSSQTVTRTPGSCGGGVSTARVEP